MLLLKCINDSCLVLRVQSCNNDQAGRQVQFISLIQGKIECKATNKICCKHYLLYTYGGRALLYFDAFGFIADVLKILIVQGACTPPHVRKRTNGSASENRTGK